MHNSERNMIDDGDVELLEAMLDGELTDGQREELRARLEKEPKLAAELEQLREERKLREQMFSSLEGGEEAVVERILITARMSGRAGPTKIRLRYAMAAAACVVVGFLIGWIGATGGKSAAKASEAPYQVQIVDESGQVMAVQRFPSLEKAREFSDDLQQWQIRQERLLNLQVTVHSARF